MLTSEIAAAVVAETGVAFDVTRAESPDGPVYQFTPDGVDPLDGFTVRTVVGWQSVASSVEFGPYAAGLLHTMEKSNAEQRAAFRSFSRVAVGSGAVLTLSINGTKISPLSDELWTSSWDECALALLKAPLDTGEGNPQVAGEVALKWSRPILGMVISLLPLEEADSPIGDAVEAGLPEGACTRVSVNRYERSARNRAICIAARGTQCEACGMDFEATYGELGRSFIEVHHVVPVSKLGPDYAFDPLIDLVPLCPNCHAMVHRMSPPLSPRELADLMRVKAATRKSQPKRTATPKDSR